MHWSSSELDEILREVAAIEAFAGSKDDSKEERQGTTPRGERGAGGVNGGDRTQKTGSMPSSLPHPMSSGHHHHHQQQQLQSHPHQHLAVAHQQHLALLQQQHSSRIESPDNDSAFSDNASMLSSESSASGSGGSSGQQQQQQQQQPHNGTKQQKVDKLNVALSRLSAAAAAPRQAASTTTVQVKIFCADGSTASVMVDGQMGAADLLDVLVDKNHVQLQPTWAIVEHIPELYMERCLEDDECVMSVLCTWKADAKNKLLFVPRPERYDLFRRPERYLLGTAPQTTTQQWDQGSRQTLLQEVFYPEGEDIKNAASPLEIEGPLWIRLEGKKSWKKQYFVLLRSGLYFHGGKGKKVAGGQVQEKDLTCLLPNFDGHHVYFGVGWKKKYKSPTEHCLALKPPAAQVKADQKFIVYLCAESDLVLQQWVAAIRIVRNRISLLDNYNRLLAKMQTGTGKEELYAAMRFQEEPDGGAVTAGGGDFRVVTMLHQQAEADEMSDAGNASVMSSSSSYCSSDEPRGILTNGGGSLSVPNGSNGDKDTSNTSMSSGCLSETSSISENGFDAEFPEGGTIRRNKVIQAQQQQQPREEDEGNLTPTPSEDKTESNSNSNTLRRNSDNSRGTSVESAVPPPPPPLDASTSQLATQTKSLCPDLSSSQLGGSSQSLNSLPPPPEELKFPLRYPPSQSSVRPYLSHAGGDITPPPSSANATTTTTNSPNLPLATHQSVRQQLPINRSSPGNFHNSEVCPPPPPPASVLLSPTLTSSLPPPPPTADGNFPQTALNSGRASTQVLAVAAQQFTPPSSSSQPCCHAVAPPPQAQPNKPSQQFCPPSSNGARNDGNQVQCATREPLYPCGVFRAVFPKEERPASNAGPPASQMDLLRQLPNNAPVRPFSNVQQQLQQQQLQQEYQRQQMADINQSGLPVMMQQQQQRPRKKSITFNETVVHINVPNSSEALKDSPEGESSTQTMMKNAMMQQQQLCQQQQLISTAHVGCWPSSSERNPNPGKLFKENGKSNGNSQQATTSTPPKAFLNDLQRVMQKKWAVAQRFHFPHQNQQQQQQQQCQQLKQHRNGQPATNFQEERRLQMATERFANHYNEKDVSMWILQSLKHSHEPPSGEADMSQDLCDLRSRNKMTNSQNKQSDDIYGFPTAASAVTSKSPGAAPEASIVQKVPHEYRPKIYNGRSVPNCFPPSSAEQLLPPPQPSAVMTTSPTPPQFQQIPVQNYQQQQHHHVQNHNALNSQPDTAVMMTMQHHQLPQQHPHQPVPTHHGMMPQQQQPKYPPPTALAIRDVSQRPAPPRRSDATQLTSPR